MMGAFPSEGSQEQPWGFFFRENRRMMQTWKLQAYSSGVGTMLLALGLSKDFKASPLSHRAIDVAWGSLIIHDLTHPMEIMNEE